MIEEMQLDDTLQSHVAAYCRIATGGNGPPVLGLAAALPKRPGKGPNYAA